MLIYVAVFRLRHITTWREASLCGGVGLFHNIRTVRAYVEQSTDGFLAQLGLAVMLLVVVLLVLFVLHELGELVLLLRGPIFKT
jgi:hypothetical protein